MCQDWRQEIEKIHVRAINKNIKPWSYEDTRFLTLALCGECGELANLIKKHWRGDPVEWPELNPEVEKELADICMYLHLLAVALSVDLDEAIKAKLPEIRKKFPIYEPHDPRIAIKLSDLPSTGLRESYESTREGRPIRANVETDPTLVELPPE